MQGIDRHGMLAVTNKVNGEVYLEGRLERGVVPEECVWEYGGGSGQDGCILYLQKMNLELLRRSTPLSVALVSLPALPAFLPHSALALPCLLNGSVLPCPVLSCLVLPCWCLPASPHALCIHLHICFTCFAL